MENGWVLMGLHLKIHVIHDIILDEVLFKQSNTYIGYNTNKTTTKKKKRKKQILNSVGPNGGIPSTSLLLPYIHFFKYIFIV